MENTENQKNDFGQVGKVQEAWNRSLERLEKEIDPQIFSAYIKPLSVHDWPLTQCIAVLNKSFIIKQSCGICI